MEETGSIRLIIFASTVALMVALEFAFPKRQRNESLAKRWLTNLSIALTSTLMLRFFLPILAVGVAALMAERGWGIFNLTALPTWLEFFLSILILDMLIYWQHVASHKFAFLWSFHKVHHADRDIDASTGVRFHPVEIFLSMAYKIACVSALGAPVLAVLVFEILLNAAAIFNHANLGLPKRLDKFLRLFVVTPDMHRVHHSSTPSETNSNYGFFLPFWDYIFNSYTDQPALGHTKMEIGLAEYQNEKPSLLVWCLLLPFDKSKTTASKSD